MNALASLTFFFSCFCPAILETILEGTPSSPVTRPVRVREGGRVCYVCVMCVLCVCICVLCVIVIGGMAGSGSDLGSGLGSGSGFGAVFLKVIYSEQL